MLVKELQSLCLDIQVLDKDGNVIELKEDEDALDTFNLSRMDADDDRHRNVAEDAEFEASGFELKTRRRMPAPMWMLTSTTNDPEDDIRHHKTGSFESLKEDNAT